MTASSLVQQLLGEDQASDLYWAVTTYPIRYNVWTASFDEACITADRSELRGIPRDPWDRPLPPVENWEVRIDREGELTHWRVVVTVAGRDVELIIFND